MKETPLSNVVKASLLENIQNKTRLDERDLMDLRPWEISFGQDYGSCTVSLGDTKVFGSVSIV